jgi:hypothetical protein
MSLTSLTKYEKRNRVLIAYLRVTGAAYRRIVSNVEQPGDRALMARKNQQADRLLRLLKDYDEFRSELAEVITKL